MSAAGTVTTSAAAEADAKSSPAPAPDPALASAAAAPAAEGAAVAVVSLAEWQSRRQVVAAAIGAELQAAPNTENNAKRKLYTDLELLRMDYCDQPAVAAYLHAREHETDKPKIAALDATPIGAEVTAELSAFDALRKQLRVPHPKPNVARVIVALLSATAYTLVAIPALLALLPVRLLHPVFRAFGVHNNWLPIDIMQKWYARAVLAIAGVRVTFDGLEHVNAGAGAEGSGGAVAVATPPNTVAMFTHASNWDPFLVSAGPVAFKWIGKKSLFLIPLLGWLMYGWGHIPIDRSNRTKAIASLAEAVQRIHKWGRSIAISPEGTRSKSGRLMDFKKGPFHTAVHVGLPITPVLVFGAYESWPPGQVFGCDADVVVRYLPRIAVTKTDTPHTLLLRVRREILKGLALPLEPAKYSRYYDPNVALGFIPIAYAVLYALYKIYLS